MEKTYPDDGINPFLGSYKITQRLLSKIMNSKISNYELQLLVYLTQICDKDGLVESFKISEISDVLCCSKKGAYNILSGLQKKGFISISKIDSWCGIYSIQILDNHYSKNVRYVSTNRKYLCPAMPEWNKFRYLSLYAKKLLIYLLYSYDRKHMYKVNTDTLKNILNIKNKKLVMGYLKEIEHVLGEAFYELTDSIDKRRKNTRNVIIQKDNYVLTPESGIENEQDSWFKHYIRYKLKYYGLKTKSVVTNSENSLLHILYGTVMENISAGYEKIIEVINRAFQEHYIFDEFLLVSIRKELQMKVAE